MATFTNVRFRYASSSEIGRDIVDVVPMGLKSVDVTRVCGRCWTARPGDGSMWQFIGGGWVECARCHRQATLPPKGA
jgi:hypothetical protein